MYWKSIEDRGWRTKLKNTSPYIIINIHWLLLSSKSLKTLWNSFSCNFVHSLTWHEIVCDFVHVSMGKICCCPGLNTLYTIKTLTHHTLHRSNTVWMWIVVHWIARLFFLWYQHRTSTGGFILNTQFRKDTGACAKQL